ncbi:MAG TPA: cation diffusion facilitator family transporter [Casimicrobiaceae bacterium]|jgi:cation diffusion facilitator family transporter
MKPLSSFMRPSTSRRPDTGRSILYALCANAVIATCKLLGALFTGSGALLAESFHSLADTGNECLLLWGRRQARAPASSHHPLGQGRATYFWSFIVALLLFALGGLFSIYEGVRKFHDPAPLDAPWIAVTIVFIAMAAEGISLRVALKQVDKVRRGLSLWRWFRETRRSELIVVVGEDMAAIAGLMLALAALLATIATDNVLYDALGSIAIGVLLIVVASGLVVEIKSLLIGESAHPRARRAIRAFLNAQPGIAKIENLVTMQHGEYLIVAVQARMDTKATAAELVETIAACKAALHENFPTVAWIFFEPTGATAHRKARRSETLRTRIGRIHSRAR